MTAGADPERLARLDAQAATAGEAAKWLTVVLAGFGATLLTGLQLSNFGAVEGVAHFVAVGVGGTVALAGVIAAVMITVGVMLPRRASLGELAQREDGVGTSDKVVEWVHTNASELLGSKDKDIRALLRDYRDALGAQVQALEKNQANPNAETNRRARETSDTVVRLNGIAAELVAATRAHETQRSLRTARRAVLALAVVVGLAAIAFIWGLSPPDRPAVDLRGADLTGGQLRGAELSGAQLDGMTIQGVDLRGTFLGGASTKETTWRRVVCPDGTDSANAGDTCDGHLEP